MSSERTLAQMIKDDALVAEVNEIINAVNELTASHRTNRAAVIVACAQMLAQNITQVSLDIASDMRAATMALIDGYAIQAATRDIES